MLLLIELMLGLKTHSAKICFIHSQYQLSAENDLGCLEGGMIHLRLIKFVLFIFAMCKLS